MSPTQITEIRGMLEARLAEIGNDIAPTIRKVQATLAVRADVSQGDVEVSIAQMRAQEIAGIKKALAKITCGSFGYCSECGDEILFIRLMALPFAQRCKDCQEAEDHRKRIEEAQRQRDGVGMFLMSTTAQ